MKKFTRPQEEFIIRMIAECHIARDIAATFATVFPDTRCSEQDVIAMDPRLTVVDPELFALFRTRRDEILDDPDSTPLASSKMRVFVLSRLLEKCVANNQPAEARAMLFQIAQETGDIASTKGAKTSAGGAGAGEAAAVGTITRTIVDPKPVSEDAHEPETESESE